MNIYKFRCDKSCWQTDYYIVVAKNEVEAKNMVTRKISDNIDILNEKIKSSQRFSKLEAEKIIDENNIQKNFMISLIECYEKYEGCDKSFIVDIFTEGPE